MGDEDVLRITNLAFSENVTGVNIDADDGEILINPGETKRFFLTYKPEAAGESFAENNGLTIVSNATNAANFNVHLQGKSTYNSDISYDGTVNVGDLIPLQQPGLFGSSAGDENYDPTADITGDGNETLTSQN